MNVALLEFAATVTEAGTVSAEVRLLERFTLLPPEVAAAESVTVQDVAVEGVRFVLAQLNEETVMLGVTVTTVVDWPKSLKAVKVTGWDAVTAAAVAENVAEFADAGTMTVVGTVSAEVILLDRLTVFPPAGAAPERVTVQDTVEEAGTD
jgi:hypothetical protein